nr:acyl-CoA dehydrogenase family protein [Cupriavidus sp. L7L]
MHRRRAVVPAKAGIQCLHPRRGRESRRVADRAVRILGGSGYISEFGIERFYRDVRLFRLYEGTTQIQQVIIARNMICEARGA